MTALTPEQTEAIAAILNGNVPASAEPTVVGIASPFASTKAAKAEAAYPPAIAAILKRFAGDKAAQKREIARTLEAGWTCSIDATATLSDGTTVPSALHGFTTPRESGIACPGLSNLAKGEACPGTIR